MGFSRDQIAANQTNAERRKYRSSLELVSDPETAPDEGQVGVAYDGFTIEASGGNEPYVYFAAPGGLPPGLEIDPATGAVSGTPDEAGTTEIVVGARDAGRRVGYLARFNLTIAEA